MRRNARKPEPPKNPVPRLWQYQEGDKSTWAYINCVIAGKGNSLYVSRWIKNPDFKYEHLMKDY